MEIISSREDKGVSSVTSLDASVICRTVPSPETYPSASSIATRRFSLNAGLGKTAKSAQFSF